MRASEIENIGSVAKVHIRSDVNIMHVDQITQTCKKRQKKEEKVLTKGMGGGIITKLSTRAKLERAAVTKEERAKKKL